MRRSHVIAVLVCLVIGLVVAPRAARADDAPEYACKVPPAGSKMTVAFQPDTSLLELVAWVTSFTCKNVVVDGEARGRVPKVTIVAPNKLTPKQALDLFVDAVQVTGLAVTVKKDTILITLGKSMPRNCPAVADTPAPARSEPSTISTELTPENQKLVDDGVRKVDDTHVEISKALADAVKANADVFLRGARIVPSIKDGKPYGIKLYAIRPSSLIAKLGLTNGDTLLKLNGLDLSSADKALEAISKITLAAKIVIDVERRGKPFTLTITVLAK